MPTGYLDEQDNCLECLGTNIIYYLLFPSPHVSYRLIGSGVVAKLNLINLRAVRV